MKLLDRIVYRLEYLSQNGYPWAVFLLLISMALALLGIGFLLLTALA